MYKVKMMKIPAKKFRLWAAVLALPVTVIVQTQVSHAAQICYTDVLETSPAADFTDNGDGTVTDDRSGRMWSVCAEGQTWSAGSCTGTHTTHSWDAALAVATTQNTATFLGYADWRLPNKNELASIIELSCREPALNATVFPDAANTTYWTSTPYYVGGAATNAWRVVFMYGNVTRSARTDALAVRLVRN